MNVLLLPFYSYLEQFDKFSNTFDADLPLLPRIIFAVCAIVLLWICPALIVWGCHAYGRPSQLKASSMEETVS